MRAFLSGAAVSVAGSSYPTFLPLVHNAEGEIEAALTEPARVAGAVKRGDDLIGLCLARLI